MDIPRLVPANPGLPWKKASIPQLGWLFFGTWNLQKWVLGEWWLMDPLIITPKDSLLKFLFMGCFRMVSWCFRIIWGWFKDTCPLCNICWKLTTLGNFVWPKLEFAEATTQSGWHDPLHWRYSTNCVGFVGHSAVSLGDGWDGWVVWVASIKWHYRWYVMTMSPKTTTKDQQIWRRFRICIREYIPWSTKTF